MLGWLVAYCPEPSILHCNSSMKTSAKDRMARSSLRQNVTCVLAATLKSSNSSLASVTSVRTHLDTSERNGIVVVLGNYSLYPFKVYLVHHLGNCSGGPVLLLMTYKIYG